MHTKPMAETEGTFRAPEPTKYTCRKCGKREATCATWDSSCGGYEDDKYTCGACGHSWWVEGPDS